MRQHNRFGRRSLILRYHHVFSLRQFQTDHLLLPRVLAPIVIFQPLRCNLRVAKSLRRLRLLHLSLPLPEPATVHLGAIDRVPWEWRVVHFFAAVGRFAWIGDLLRPHQFSAMRLLH